MEGPCVTLGMGIGTLGRRGEKSAEALPQNVRARICLEVSPGRFFASGTAGSLARDDWVS